MRTRIFAGPGRYVQGSGVLHQCGTYMSHLGSKAFLVSDDVVWDIIGQDVETALSGEIDYLHESFNGESSDTEILRLAKNANKGGADFVVGLGGGKTLDTVKAVADELGSPVAIVPTAASTDAPCSALSVIYSDEGTFQRYRLYDRHPDLVLVDTHVCAQAPARLFASGIADGLATHIEARAARRTDTTTALGGAATIAGMAIAKACEDTLLAYGYGAYKSVENKLVTPAVEAVVEANTLLSGLGFECAGLAGAHAIHNGFTAIQGDVHKLTHGEKVAYGTLTHMMLNNEPDEVLARYIRFYRSIKMPTTLEEMYLDKVSHDELVSVGEVANREGDTLRNLATDITPQMVADALKAVDVFSKTVT